MRRTRKWQRPLADAYTAEIRRVRKGDILAAQTMLRDCAKALRQRGPGGGNSLSAQHASYLSLALDRFARDPAMARLFCLAMPTHRPVQAEDSAIHLERARKVLAEYQHGGTLEGAMRAVAKRENKSTGAIRASWRAKGFQAEMERLAATPKSKRSDVRLPQRKGGT